MQIPLRPLLADEQEKAQELVDRKAEAVRFYNEWKASFPKVAEAIEKETAKRPKLK